MDSGPIWVNSKWVGFNFRRINPGSSDLTAPFEYDDTVTLAAELAGADEATGAGPYDGNAAGR